MAFLKISPDLFLEAAELNRLKQFIDDDGFRKNILDNTTAFGLIKTTKDFNFSNGRVERDLDTVLGQRTIKIRELFGIDKFGNFLHLLAQSGIPVPNDGNWYWVKVAHAFSSIEKGIFTISGNGDLIDTSGQAELTTILRGMPNFPARIRFTNSQYNTLEYDVLEVIDDLNATIQHPASTINGISEFTPETDLKIEIVGTFTQGIAVPSASKLPFNYDSAIVTLELETLVNQAPAFVSGQDFYLARIQATSSTVIIQDRRIEYWETKGSGNTIEISRVDNPLIGVESVQFNNLLSPSDRNIVKLAWGFRSDSWNIDTSNNIVTFNNGLGGKYKTVNDFQNGDLVGGRLYTTNGKYSRIISTTKQGSAIQFGLDVLDVNNFSPDGGATLISGTLLAVPDADSIEIQFTPNPVDDVAAFQESFTFPINEFVGRCDVLVYKDPSVLYNVKYRYKSFKEFTQYKPIQTDTVYGYFTEASFNDNGKLKESSLQVRYPYTSDPTNGFIQLILSSNAISRFRSKVDKGDIIGVRYIDDFGGFSEIDLQVGVSKNYIYLDGSLRLSNDVSFNLLTNGAVEGNEFRIHFNCTDLNLSGFVLNIVENLGTASARTLKTIGEADIYQMKNQEGGIVFDLVYKGNKWIFYQNYSVNAPFELKDYTTIISDAIKAQVGLLAKGNIHVGDVSNDRVVVITHNLNIVGSYAVTGSLEGSGTNDGADDDVTYVITGKTPNTFKLVIQETSGLTQDLSFSYLIWQL